MAVSKGLMTLALILAVGATLGGCKTDQQIAADAASDDASCRSYGAEPGTPIYVQCRLQKDQLREQEKADRIAAFAAIRPR